MKFSFGAQALIAAVLSVTGSTALADGECDAFSDPIMKKGCEMRQSGFGLGKDDSGELTRWIVRKDTSTFDDSNTVILSVKANEIAACGFSPAKPTLIVRCQENTTSMYIATSCHVASGFKGYGKVDLRVDDRKAYTVTMDHSTDNKALGLWTGVKSIWQVKKIFGGDVLAARFTPFNESPVEVTFPIAGLEAVIEPLRKECGW